MQGQRGSDASSSKKPRTPSPTASVQMAGAKTSAPKKKKTGVRHPELAPRIPDNSPPFRKYGYILELRILPEFKLKPT